MNSDRWQADLKKIHEDSMSFAWQPHLDELNRNLDIQADPFTVSLKGLPPIWFNGDVEAIVPHRWTLVVSLNHQLGGYPQPPTAAEMWDFCRTHNRVHWYPRFFRPLVKVSATALGEEVLTEDEREYATSRMVFVELCPYASQRFSLQPDQVAKLAADDVGFRTAAQVTGILLERAQPALILVNGAATLANFERLYGPQFDGWRDIVYASAYSEGRTLWHKQGFLSVGQARYPVIGFPFLRTVRSHNANVEIRQLGILAREFLIAADHDGGNN